ncbi:MAG: hypothetical protein KAZ14_00060 [Nitrosomonas sp.]|nr:hypothetical protein [Nitrosomonas sp.]
MSKLSFIYKNVFDARDTLTLDAGVSVAGFTVANLAINKKSITWRSGSSALHRVKTTWAQNQTISGVAICFTNLVSGDSVNIKLYSDVAGTTNIYTSGNITVTHNYDVPAGFSSVNSTSFAYGGGIHISHLLAEKTNVRRMDIEFNVSSNPAGFVEASRIVAGKYWSPERSAALGARIGFSDSTSSFRTYSGDLVTDRGSISRTLDFNVNAMSESDKSGWNNLFRSVGKSNPFFVGIAGSSNSISEEIISGSIYGKFESDIDVSTQLFKRYGSQVRIVEL